MLFRDEIVLVNGRGDAHLGLGIILVNAHHFTSATHANALCERDLRRQSKSEFDGRALSDLGVQVEENTPRAYVFSLGGGLSRAVGKLHREGKFERKTARITQVTGWHAGVLYKCGN